MEVKIMMRRAMVSVFILAFLQVLTPCVAHGQIGKALARAARKNVAKSAERSWLSILKKDALRDRTLPPQQLPSERSVFRYTTKSQALRESREGISAGSHLTSRSRPGRPLSAESAQQRFGLPKAPTVREKVVLPKGSKVQSGRAIGGKPGYGELRLTKPVKPQSIQRVVPLRKNHVSNNKKRSDHIKTKNIFGHSLCLERRQPIRSNWRGIRKSRK